MSKHIVILPGDGIGPEIMAEAEKVLAKVNDQFGLGLSWSHELLGGAAMGRSYPKLIMGEAVRLTEQAWRTLSIRWGVFFLTLAVLNEIVWRTQTTDFWVAFKVWGTMPITLLFTLSQMPVIMKHSLEQDTAA